MTEECSATLFRLARNVTDDQVLDFARNTIRSVWALDLLLFMRSSGDRTWAVADLVAELRSSEVITVSCLERLVAENLIGREQNESLFRYAPRSAEQEALIGELAKMNTSKPMALAKAIREASNEKLTIFPRGIS